MGSSLRWGRRAGGVDACGGSAGAMPEGQALWYGAVLEQCLKPMWDQEGLHLVGRNPHGTQARL